VPGVSTSIILVEDDLAYAELMSEGLQDAWPGDLEVVRFARMTDARPRLAEGRADCVLLDLSLPDGQGLELVHEVLAAAPGVPVVVLTGRGEEDGLGSEAVRAGAQDYLVKGRVRDEEVARAVRYAIERKRGELERVHLEREYARQALVAETLQRGLLPELPVVPGLEVGARYLPSGPAGRVGGDWYDLISMPDGRVVAAVGDVAGHGLHAASLMGQLATALRAYALQDPSPESVLGGLNRLLCHFAREEIATLVYALLDPSDGTMTVAYAGHPPALLIRADGTAELVEGGRGTLLGISPGIVESISVPWAPGDALVLYTDGLVERRRESMADSLARLVSSAASMPAGEPAALAEHLVDDLAPDGERDDDVAVLAIRHPAALNGRPPRGGGGD
jgi:serine phosphatase RsbU (regulator of sigma subunit)